MFAIDLLHAELRLRKCDGEDIVNFDFDGDGNYVSTIMPSLLAVVDEIGTSVEDDSNGIWNGLKVRCFWLAASVFFWRGKLSSCVGESRMAEHEGLKWMEEAQRCLRGSDSVPTPHLGSPRRKGHHWKELSEGSLSVLAGEIQASSIVLLAQEQFLEATSKFGGAVTDVTLEKEDCDALCLIGESLLERYACGIDAPGAKHAELIDDFIGVHGDMLSATAIGEPQSAQATEVGVQLWFDSLFPPGRIEVGGPFLPCPTPCILTILITCLRTKEEHNFSILLLLVRVVGTMFDLSDVISSRLKLEMCRGSRADSCDDFSDSESDAISVSDADDVDKDDGSTSANADFVRLNQYATLVRLCLTRSCSICQVEMTADERASFAHCAEFASMLSRSLTFSAEWFHFTRPMTNDVHSIGQGLETFLAAQALFRLLMPDSVWHEAWTQRLSRLYLMGLFQIVVAQRRALSDLSRSKPSTNGRSERIRLTRKRADLVAAVCCDAGLLLSKNPGGVANGQMELSMLFIDPYSNLPLTVPLTIFCDSLLWFWRVALSSDSTRGENCGDGSYLGSYLDGFGRERLRAPVATAIIGLCGSATSTNRGSFAAESADEQIALLEFCDSDASATEWLSDVDGCNVDDKATTCREELLRVIMQAIHCVSLVFGRIDEKDACTSPHVKYYLTRDGPCLPLVVARVLNNFARFLLVDFRKKGEDSGMALWSEFPNGTRSVGLILDSGLYKAYKCLHGFSLSPDAKESSTSINVSGATGCSKQSKQFSPESKEAAAMLYRCITRAYSQGRRSPPKAALEAILGALPEIEESEKSGAIRRYLFSTDMSKIETARLVALAAKHPNWETSLMEINGFDWVQADAEEASNDETAVVRRGLSKIIANGPIPRFQENANEKDCRSLAAHAEEELSTKFFAVIDDLCFGDTNDCEGWFKASQCLSMKADLIADRLGLSIGFARKPRFSISDRPGVAEACLDLAGLDALQEREALLNDEGCVQCLGKDLSLFVRYNWSSFASLKLCSKEVGKAYRNQLESCEEDDQEILFRSRVWKEICDLYDRKDFVRWQQAWGGIFVSALRKTAYRCLSVALYTANNVGTASADIRLCSEITESLGVSFYSALMGSQMYGYPMKIMSSYRKRQMAEAAAVCFERAIELVASEDQTNDNRENWDLLFMLGKVRL